MGWMLGRFRVLRTNWTEEQQEELRETYEDDDECFSMYEFLENRGFDALDVNYQIHGGVIVEEAPAQLENIDAY